LSTASFTYFPTSGSTFGYDFAVNIILIRIIMAIYKNQRAVNREFSLKILGMGLVWVRLTFVETLALALVHNTLNSF